MSPKPARKLRCAVYTRKSSEEGLEQGFNSLHAQREACEAYIKSQAGEGWVLLRKDYDDGGFSGGNMDRPALVQLLADVEAGLVDTVVVYKVDRLTRSLTDFARIVDVFDRAGASFVSITQAFNTTTSMGRLTLNVLLSFAQFEREVTGERIRDKIAQSKAKGMWMGGNLPLGYDAGDHVLVVNEAEAETVRHIFRRYLDLGSVHALEGELDGQAIRSKAWVSSQGRAMGGARFTRGALYHLLQNQHYRGLIKHRDQVFPGLHPAIVDESLFEQVQARLAENRVGRSERETRASKALLVGIVFDRDTEPYTPTFSKGRGGKTYRYYIAGQGTGAPRRLPAEALEEFVVGQLRRISECPALSPAEVGEWIQRIEIGPTGVQLVIRPKPLFGGAHRELALTELQGRLGAMERAVWDDVFQAVRISLPVKLRFRGGQTWLTGTAPEPGSRQRKPNPSLVRALKQAHAVLAQLHVSPLDKHPDLSTAKAPSNTYLTRLARLAFLAPDIQRDILAGREPHGPSVKQLLEADIPLAWREQREWIRSVRGASATGSSVAGPHGKRSAHAERPEPRMDIG